MSLKNKISFSIILIIFVFGSLATYSVFHYAKRSLVDNGKESLRHEIVEFSDELGQIFSHAKKVVATIANQNTVKAYLSEDEIVMQDQDILQYLEYFNIGDMYSAIYIMSPDGLTLVSTDPSFTGNNYDFRDYFKKSLDGYPAVDITVGATSKKLGYYFSHPIKSDKGEILGVVVTKMKPEAIHESIKFVNPNRGAHVMLVDERGIIIYSDKTDIIYKSLGILSDKQKEAIKEKKRFSNIDIQPAQYSILQNNLNKIQDVELFEFYDEKDGEEELVGIIKMKDLPLFFIVEEETEKYSQAAVKIAYILSFFVILAAMFAGVIIFIFVGRFLKPLSSLHESAVRLGQGDFSSFINMEKGSGELYDLSFTFNKMIDDIKKSRVEITKKVKDQTKEITDKSKDMANQQIAILNILEDVEDEKNNVAQEKDKIEAILHSIGDGVFVVDKDLKITMINQVAVDLAEFTVGDSTGKHYGKSLKFVFEKNGKINDKFIRDAIATGEVQEMSNHTHLITKSGKKVPVADSSAPLKNQDGKVIGCVVVFRDVTKERRIDQAKTEFVSLASHQLRTPLSTIKWYTEMLMSGDAGKLAGDQEKYLKEIYKGNERMVGLVNALLNVSRLELGTFAVEPESINFVDIAKSVLNELKPVIEQKKLKVKEVLAKNCPNIDADPRLVRIIFQNLLSNATKYTPEGGKINVKVEILESNILVEVADTGMGIPKKQQKEIFKKLFRADNVREQDTEGTGLGLYIVKSIVDNTGGKIWFKSAKNKGTTFSLTIPLSGMKKKKGAKTLS